jgi:integrase
MLKLNDSLLTLSQVAAIFDVGEHVIELLVKTGRIPHTAVTCAAGETQLRFDPAALDAWLKRGSLEAADSQEAAALKTYFTTLYPKAIGEVKSLETCIVPNRSAKGFSLSKVKNKEFGFIYYVRYSANGKTIPSRWSTHTNNKALAEQFAAGSRDRLLAGWKQKKTVRDMTAAFFEIFDTYYAEGSPYLQDDRHRGRPLREPTRKIYHNFMRRTFVPYLREQKTASLAEIDAPFLARFQNYLLRKGVKPQTANHGISYISRVFKHLVIEGYCAANPCKSLEPLKAGEEDVCGRGCYDLSTLRGVFNRRWENRYSYLLCLLIHTTNMRNSEIGRLQVKDLITLEGVPFINIPKSKTPSGERIVPLHPFVYRKLLHYIKDKNKQPDDYALSRNGKIGSRRWTEAYLAMGALLGYTQERLAEEHITFYSGRHFWKTLTNAEELGDVEEYFMGHKVSAGVAERYNHRDKQGLGRVLHKARAVFAALDRRLFTRTKPAQPVFPPPAEPDSIHGPVSTRSRTAVPHAPRTSL